MVAVGFPSRGLLARRRVLNASSGGGRLSLSFPFSALFNRLICRVPTYREHESAGFLSLCAVPLLQPRRKLIPTTSCIVASSPTNRQRTTTTEDRAPTAAPAPPLLTIIHQRSEPLAVGASPPTPCALPSGRWQVRVSSRFPRRWSVVALATQPTTRGHPLLGRTTVCWPRRDDVDSTYPLSTA